LSIYANQGKAQLDKLHLNSSDYEGSYIEIFIKAKVVDDTGSSGIETPKLSE